MPEDIIFSWSSGKDSALALYQILKAGEYRIASILTTVVQDYDRVGWRNRHPHP